MVVNRSSKSDLIRESVFRWTMRQNNQNGLVPGSVLGSDKERPCAEKVDNDRCFQPLLLECGWSVFVHLQSKSIGVLFLY